MMIDGTKFKIKKVDNGFYFENEKLTKQSIWYFWELYQEWYKFQEMEWKDWNDWNWVLENLEDLKVNYSMTSQQIKDKFSPLLISRLFKSQMEKNLWVELTELFGPMEQKESFFVEKKLNRYDVESFYKTFRQGLFSEGYSVFVEKDDLRCFGCDLTQYTNQIFIKGDEVLVVLSLEHNGGSDGMITIPELSAWITGVIENKKIGYQIINEQFKCEMWLLFEMLKLKKPELQKIKIALFTHTSFDCLRKFEGVEVKKDENIFFIDFDYNEGATIFNRRGNFEDSITFLEFLKEFTDNHVLTKTSPFFSFSDLMFWWEKHKNENH